MVEPSLRKNARFRNSIVIPGNPEKAGDDPESSNFKTI